MLKEYIDLGWALTPVRSKTKSPELSGWNLRENAITVEGELSKLLFKNVGLLHAYSGTCAIDIDDYENSKWFFKHRFNVDVEQLFDEGVRIDSGNPNHYKFLYKCPPKETKKIIYHGATLVEFRSATKDGLTVQDVLPPSVHPSGKKYEWFGDYTNLPDLPDYLMNAWDECLKPLVHPIRQLDIKETPDNDLLEYLQYIPPDCPRDEWIAVGMALHWWGSKSESTDVARDMWDDWSKKGSKYKGPSDINTQWKSFKETSSPRTTATIKYVAQKYGYQDDYSRFFGNISLNNELLLGVKPPSPQIPSELFPKILKNYATEVSRTMGADLVIPLWAGMGAACGAIDARSRLELLPGFEVPPTLWLMTVGAPGEKKSPGSDPMRAPLDVLEAEHVKKFKEELLAWEGIEAAHAASKKAYLEFSAGADAVLGNVKSPMVVDLPPKPVDLRLSAGDITSQKLIRMAAERPYGFVVWLDELGGWVRKIANPKSGEDRSAWVSAFNGSRYTMDRVTNGSVTIEKLSLSMYGNIQPDVLKQFNQLLADDGLLQRFLPITTKWENRTAGEPFTEKNRWMSMKPIWEKTLRGLYQLGEQKYKLSKEAYDEFREFQKWFDSYIKFEMSTQAGGSYLTALSKVEGQIGRFTLVFHMIEAPMEKEVQVDTLKRVIDLFRNFIMSSIKNTFRFANKTQHIEQWVMDFLVTNSDYSIISMADLRRRTRYLFKDEDSPERRTSLLLEAMEYFEGLNWVRRVDSKKFLFKNSMHWAVHPQLAKHFEEDDYREQMIESKVRMRECFNGTNALYRVGGVTRNVALSSNSDQTGEFSREEGL